jgi:hypothetical protein
MAYLPNIFEQNPNAIPDSLNGLIKAFAPDFVAQQRFDQLVQQNPALLDEIANMEDGQRETYSKSLGAKNKNPLAKIGIGAKRKDREAEAAIIAGMTPEEAATYRANKVGFTPQAMIDRKKKTDAQGDLTFDQGQALAPLQLEGAKIDLKGKQTRLDADTIELTTARDNLARNQALVAAIPKVEQETIKQLADSIVYRKPFKGDQQMAERVKGDKIYGPILQDYIQSAQNDLEIRSRKDLQNLRGPQEKQWAFQYLKDQADNAQNTLKSAEINLSKIDPNMVLTPEGQASYQQAQLAVQEAAKNAAEINNKYVEFGNRQFGLDVQSKEDRDAAEIVSAIFRGDITIEDVVARSSPAFAGKVKAAILASGRDVPAKKPSMFGASPNPFGTKK